MAIQPKPNMTADEFLAWAEGQSGRHELHNGVVYAMAPERSGLAKMKLRIARILQDSITKVGCQCWALPDGMAVRVNARKVYEPDALVYCGPELPDDALEVPNPVILVEVLSPSTRYVDAAAKLAGYFNILSVHHYLMIDPNGPPLIHHQRQTNGDILTRLIPADGVLRLDPPGLELDVARIFTAS